MADEGQQGSKQTPVTGEPVAKAPAPTPPPLPASLPESQRPTAVSGYFPLLDDKPVTPHQAQAVFDKLSGISDISFGFAGDGCYARAHLMCENLLGEGHTPGKAWAFREAGGAPLTVETPAGKEIFWRYHVAPDLPVQMPDGRVERMVIDPSLFDGPVTLNRWGESMQAHSGQLFQTPLNAAPPGHQGDYNPAEVTTHVTTNSAQGTMRDFLPLQDERNVFACDLGACAAGESAVGKPLVAGRRQLRGMPVPLDIDLTTAVTAEMPIPTKIHAPVVEGGARPTAHADLAPPVEPTGSKFKPNGAGAAIGLATGVVGLENAIERGDVTGGAIASTNILTSTVEGAESIAVATGRSLPALKAASRYVPGVNMAVTAVDGAYQILKEDTPEHRQERAVAFGATATTGFVLGTAAATTAEAAAITTGITAVAGTGAIATGTAAVVVAAAPVVLVAAAVTAVAYTGDKVIEAKRAWDGVDQQIAENGAPQRRNVTYPNDNGAPDFRKFKHIFPEMLEVSRDMRDSELPFKPARDPQTGRIKFDDMRKLAESKDPRVLAEFERALDTNIDKNKKIMADNDSYLPKWIRSGDSVMKYSTAQMTLSDLQGAKTELGWHKADIAAWNPATAAIAPAKPAADQQGGTFFKKNRTQPSAGQ